MSDHVDIRFRPVSSLDRVRDNPPGAGIQRWKRLMPRSRRPLVGDCRGFLGKARPWNGLRRPNPPNVPPVDLRTEWASFEAAAAFFSDKALWEYLSGRRRGRAGGGLGGV
jgi:hypothetical protein